MDKPAMDIRALARIGALRIAREIVSEFPDILSELNALAKSPRRRTINTTPVPAEWTTPKPKRTMSAAARKRISDAQKARWKKQRAAKDAKPKK